ncbi:hypothetical protein [Alkalibacillus haloalkaliphilus]|uniref:Uncharacterized protein n=1 Tax=Alkalibacillus haloalkaliphilus TaxID=94136 RepID=A0A511W5D0_9BACI|nr:hypothetical protein [Alkalibacillus haloalkaliphilus]GEN45243.1 hypothetical protein AHA02nite_10190 [Alkalibacillus haloalkaliphilus]
MKRKHYLIGFGIIIIFVISFFVYNQTRYTTFENELSEIHSYYNHSEELTKIEITLFDINNNKGLSTVIEDPDTIESIYQQLTSTNLKKTSTETDWINNYTIDLKYSNGAPTTHLRLFQDGKLFISEPFIHGSYHETDSNKLYSYLENLKLSWDREFEFSEE